uniref:Hemolin-like protein n=1 Tax=Trichoplusia ni TaxID=7111 RepID=A9XXB2_TRINI|nr:hemolin-like protein [Trichoplusia ni]
MYRITSTVVLAACIVLCTALPVEKQKVQELPVLKDQKAEVLFRADNYSTAFLECALEGHGKDVNPLAYPDWFKENKLIEAKPGDRITDHNRTGGKRLLIKETLYEDQGTYKCEVNNGVGKKLTHSMKLTVVSAPKLSQQHEKRILVKEGEDISLPCKITGLPEPKVTWTYNTKAVSERAIYKDGVLKIKNAKKGDTGYYGC